MQAHSDRKQLSFITFPIYESFAPFVKGKNHRDKEFNGENDFAGGMTNTDGSFLGLRFSLPVCEDVGYTILVASQPLGPGPLKTFSPFFE